MIKRIQTKRGVRYVDEYTSRFAKASDYFRQYAGTPDKDKPYKKSGLTKKERASDAAFSRLRYKGRFLDKITQKKVIEFLEDAGKRDLLIQNNLSKSFSDELCQLMISSGKTYFVNTSSKTVFNVDRVIISRLKAGFDFLYTASDGMTYANKEALEMFTEDKAKMLTQLKEAGRLNCVLLYRIREEGKTISIDYKDIEVICS